MPDPTFTRRRLLQLSALAGLGVGTGAAGLAAWQVGQSRPLGSLTLHGPSAPVTVLLARLAADERLRALVPNVSTGVYQSPDELRAGIASERIQAGLALTYVAANLARRGLPIQLLNVTVWGILYVITTAPDVRGWADLKSRPVLVPFRGDMPELVFRYLARGNGLADGDLKLQYTSAPIETLQLLLAGQADVAILPEPAATGAELQARRAGREIRRLFDLQDEWARLSGKPARLPGVGTLAVTSLAREQPAVIAAIQTGLTDAAAWVKSSPAEAAAQASTYAGMEPPVIQQSLARMTFEVVPARQARPDLEAFFGALKSLSPEIIGGDLPSDDFYGG